MDAYIPEWSTGDRLRNVRRGLGMTQAEIAAVLAINEVTYSSWESDRHRMSDGKLIEIAVKLYELYGIPPAWFGVQAAKRRRPRPRMATAN